jgi:ABC-type dipeptide/oligopeptide/nickel transport system permease subunit
MTDLRDAPVDLDRAPTDAVSVDDVEALSAKPESFGQQAWKRFRSHKLAIIGSITLVLVIIAFIVGPMIRPFAFDERNIPRRALGPNGTNWFGTDDIGRDLFVRTMIGGRLSLRIAVITSLVGTSLGAIMGTLAGYYGKWVDGAISWVMNLFLTIPSLVILLIFGIKFGSSAETIALLVAGLGWVGTARIVRAEVMKYKQMEFVQAARAAGANGIRIMVRHILPNVAGSLLVAATLLAGTAIILESTLSFLSLGIQAPQASLGTLLDDAKGSIDTRPYRVLIPGGIITLIVLSINFIGDGLRDALDPTSKLDRK